MVTLIAGTTELVGAWFTGWVIDRAAVAEQGTYWAQFWPVIAVGLGFFLVIRPIVFAGRCGRWGSSRRYAT